MGYQKKRQINVDFYLHTELVHEAGTDLPVIKELLFGDKYPNAIVF